MSKAIQNTKYHTKQTAEMGGGDQGMREGRWIMDESYRKEKPTFVQDNNVLNSFCNPPYSLYVS